MELGVRKSGETLVFFAKDIDGHDVHPDIGRDGMDRILGILTDRLRRWIWKSRQSNPRTDGGRTMDDILSDRKAAPILPSFYEVIEQNLSDGYSLIERFAEHGSSSFMAYNEAGEELGDDWQTELTDGLALASALSPD